MNVFPSKRFSGAAKQIGCLLAALLLMAAPTGLEAGNGNGKVPPGQAKKQDGRIPRGKSTAPGQLKVPPGHLKNDKSTKDLLKRRIAEEAFMQTGASMVVSEARYASYAERLAKTLATLSFAEQQAIFTGN